VYALVGRHFIWGTWWSCHARGSHVWWHSWNWI